MHDVAGGGERQGRYSKTFVATNLAWYLAETGHAVTYVDTDVPDRVEEVRYAVRVPALSGGSCTSCGACQEACGVFV